MRVWFSMLTFVLLALSVPLTGLADGRAVATAERPKPVSGWLEQAVIYPPGILVHAKLDTGAESCSLHAENMEISSEDGTRWVEFELVNRYGDRKKFKREIERTTRIKLKQGGVQERPVVNLGVCLGGQYENVECNLVNRSHFIYPMLIGRNYLAGKLVIDSSETYLLQPECSFDE